MVNSLSNGDVDEDVECATAGEESRTGGRPRLREIARLWISSLRAAIYAGDAGARLVVVAPDKSKFDMGNLQSESKKRNKKNRSVESELDEHKINNDKQCGKFAKSNEQIGELRANVAFEKVQNTAKRKQIIPPKVRIYFIINIDDNRWKIFTFFTKIIRYTIR